MVQAIVSDWIRTQARMREPFSGHLAHFSLDTAWKIKVFVCPLALLCCVQIQVARIPGAEIRTLITNTLLMMLVLRSLTHAPPLRQGPAARPKPREF